MIIVPYQAEHLHRLNAQDAQQHLTPYLTKDYAKALENTLSYTALNGDKVVGCGGLIEIWENRALLWSYLDRDAGRYFVKIHRLVQEFIDLAPYRRIEAEVDCDFAAGHRWMQMLGFTLEAERMRCFRVDGGDSALYAKVKKWP